jgi:hypothetical protein
MAIDKLIVKFFAAEPPERLSDAIDVFHRWIQEQTIDGLLLDVADYAHVPDGPGIMLIGHEADHAVDEAEGPLGYLYSRKRDLSGSDEERILSVIKAAVKAALQLQREATLGLKLDAKRLRLVFNDRLNQPNDEASFASLEAPLSAALKQVYGDVALLIERDESDPRSRLTITVGASTEDDLAALGARLDSVAVG